MVILTILNYILAINIRQDTNVLQSSISANPPVLFQFQNGKPLTRCGERETAELFMGKMLTTTCLSCSLSSDFYFMPCTGMNKYYF